MSFKDSSLYKNLIKRLPEIPAPPKALLATLEDLIYVVSEESKYIILVFPEYTPHDFNGHLERLFTLADRVLGEFLYTKLNATELYIFCCGLVSHDWGMAVSSSEKDCILTKTKNSNHALLPDEFSTVERLMVNTSFNNSDKDELLQNYFRNTSGLRSGARLREYLSKHSEIFADAVAKVAEGHTFDVAEIRDSNKYPLKLAVFGESINLAAITTYVRIVDLLDIGEDRTPYVLWKFVAPKNHISQMHWQRHKCIAPIAINNSDSALREIVVSGITDNPDTFTAIADLQTWVDRQFDESLITLKTLDKRYLLDLEPQIKWDVKTIGFEPIKLKFNFDRENILNLLGEDLYGNDKLAFIRELLQNSVDAIDARIGFLSDHQDISVKGRINVKIDSSASGFIDLTWTDNGVGMNQDIVRHFFSKVGKSWYLSDDARYLQTARPISKFGIGILSYFSVSNSLAITTLRDRHVDINAEALEIDIPSVYGHFCIRKSDSKSVGTTIKMRLVNDPSEDITLESLSNAIIKTAEYIEHQLTISINGQELEIDNRDKSFKDKKESCDFVASSGRGEAYSTLMKLSKLVTFYLGGTADDYEGRYSVLFPRKPNEVFGNIDRSVWTLEGENIEFDDLLFSAETKVFLKGIHTGIVGDFRYPRFRSQQPILEHSNWMSVNLTINVKDPSKIKFDLSRTNYEFDEKLISRILEEISSKLLEKLGVNKYDPKYDPVSIGACIAFGSAPIKGILSVLDLGKLPILVLRKRQGLVWTNVNEINNKSELIEAPFELGYIETINRLGTDSKLLNWLEDDAIFPNNWASKDLPWLPPVLSLGYASLIKAGWAPCSIRVYKHTPALEVVPIILRVWKKVSLDELTFSEPSELEDTLDDGVNLLKSLYRESPEILEFENELNSFAAIGSRYWNINHPKIKKITSVLKALMVRRSRLNTNLRRKIFYYTDATFTDYVVPSRYSDATLAIEVPNHLLAIAEEAGIIEAQGVRLQIDDFYPGSVDAYKNPYHHQIKKWNILNSQ